MSIKLEALSRCEIEERYKTLIKDLITEFDLKQDLLFYNYDPEDMVLGFYDGGIKRGLEGIIDDASHAVGPLANFGNDTPYENAIDFFADISPAFQDGRFDDAKLLLIYGIGKLIERKDPTISLGNLSAASGDKKHAKIYLQREIDRQRREKSYREQKDAELISQPAFKLCSELLAQTNFKNSPTFESYERLGSGFSAAKARSYMTDILLSGAEALLNSGGKYMSADPASSCEFRPFDATELVKDFRKALRNLERIGSSYLSKLDSLRCKYGFSNEAIRHFRAITPKRFDYEYVHGTQFEVQLLLSSLQVEESIEISVEIKKRFRGNSRLELVKAPQSLIAKIGSLAKKVAAKAPTNSLDAYNYVADNPKQYLRWALMKTTTLSKYK